MRILKFLVIGMAMFIAGAGQAQISFSVNLPAPPMWGPVGYTNVSYYYLPDVEAFYDIKSSMFIYYGGGAWIRRSQLPAQYRNYDLYDGYKVVMKDYHGNAPYAHFKEYKSKYAKGYRGHGQKTIGERPGKGNGGGRNFQDGNRGNKAVGNDNGKNRGHGNDKGKNGNHNQGGGNGHGKK
jgi:hypothetical protein